MAKKTYAELKAEIEALEAQAEELRANERADVIAKIRDAISVYELTPNDLFAKKRAKKIKGAAYADGNGNTWGGRGPRPQWLKKAIESGNALEDFAV